MSESLVVSCDDCVMQHTPICQDCVVTAVCGREASPALVLDPSEVTALHLLSSVGLVPGLRHRRA